MIDPNLKIVVSPEIVLRTRTVDDAEEIFALVDSNRQYLRRWLPWLDMNTGPEHTREHIQRCNKQQQEGTGLVLAITEQEKIIGMLGYNEIDRSNRGGFIGYWLSESHTGRGIMTQSCRSLINYGFSELNLNRQGIGAAVENRASRSIPERLGLALEGIERDAEWLYDHFVDHAFYAITQKAWKNQRKNRHSDLDVKYRFAELPDVPQLAKWNHQLIRDEGHSNPMTVDQLESRMHEFLAGNYRAVVFESAGQSVAYALYREEETEIYLRQLFVESDHRRNGFGRCAVSILREQIWPVDKRLTVEVLTANHSGIAFWRALGYRDYSIKMEIKPR